MPVWAVTTLWLCLSANLLAENASDPVLSAWLDAHQKLQTWSANVVQTRHLAALTQPLVSTGRVYFCHPGLFRWELGQPPETIAIRSTNEMLLIYPGLKRAERYPVDQGNNGPLRDVLTLMEAGFPNSEAQLAERYNVSTEQQSNGLSSIVLEPRTGAARRLVDHVSLTFQTNDFTLASSAIEFADGSRLVNRYTGSVRNEPLPVDIFSTNLPPDFKQVEPLAK